MVHPRVTKFGVCVPMVGSKNPYHYKLDMMKYSFLRPILEYNRCIMGALGSTHRGKRYIIWFVAAPRWIIFCSLECGTHNTGTRNNGVYNRCILGALGSTHRGKRRIIWLLKCPDAEFLVHLSVVLTNQHQRGFFMLFGVLAKMCPCMNVVNNTGPWTGRVYASHQ